MRPWEPGWEHPQFRVGGPVNWLKTEEWEEGFDLTEPDDWYGEIKVPVTVNRVFTATADRSSRDDGHVLPVSCTNGWSLDCQTTGHTAATSTRPLGSRCGAGTRVPFAPGAVGNFPDDIAIGGGLSHTPPPRRPCGARRVGTGCGFCRRVRGGARARSIGHRIGARQLLLCGTRRSPSLR